MALRSAAFRRPAPSRARRDVTWPTAVRQISERGANMQVRGLSALQITLRDLNVIMEEVSRPARSLTRATARQPWSAVVRRRGVWRRYWDTLGSPSIQNRQGTSLALVTPVRGPVHGSDAGAPGSALSGLCGSQTSAPYSSRPMASASQSLAGPRARSRTVDPAAGVRQLPAGDDLAGADEDGRRLTLTTADEIHAEVHAVREVDVRVPGRTEHHGVAFRRASVGVRGRVGPRRTPRPR